jgi:GDP-L-fucose synthase
MYKSKRVLVTGSNGFFGKNICKELQVLGADVFCATRQDADLLNINETRTLFGNILPEIVFHCAVQGGGIGWMKENPVASGADNLRMNLNVLESAHAVKVKSFVGVSSACIYPKNGLQPYSEEAIWNGYPEPLNGPYALSKRMMMDLGRSYAEQYDMHCVFPILANLYGPGDHLVPERAHVITDLMLRSIHNLDELIVWGSGEAQREFLYIEDAVEGVLATVRAPKGEFINIGTGLSTSIIDVARLILNVQGLERPIRLDKSKPNGQLQKVMNVEKAKELLQWKATTTLENGLKKTALWYRQQVK